MSAVVPTGPAPLRSIWQREPVRVIATIFLLLNGLNALFMALNAYTLDIAAAITAFLAVASSAINELFTRATVVPIKPLEDLAERAQARLDETPG